MKLRVAIYKSPIHQYEIAEKLGISRYTLCRQLRMEISKEQQEKIFNALRELEQERGVK